MHDAEPLLWLWRNAGSGLYVIVSWAMAKLAYEEISTS